jgi:cell division protein FtsQ
MRILSIVFATLLSCYIVGASFYFKNRRQAEPCEGLEVIVTDSLDKHFVDKKDIIDLLSRNNLSPKDKSISSINTQAIEDLLMSNEMIASVEAYKTPSGLIKLEIEQKIPIMRVMSTTGNYYIDNNGKVMPISRRYVANVPFVSGYVEKDVMLPDLCKFALFLQNNKFWNSQIDQIYIQQNGEVQLIPRVGNHTIVLGSFDDFEEKLDNLSLFYKKVIPKVGWEKYEVINLTYKNQIVCTKR